MADPELVPQLKKLAEDHTTGSAVEPGRVWTSRSGEAFSEELAELGFSVCANTVNRLLRDELLPSCNLFCYGQVESPYGSGDFIRALASHFGDEHEKLVLSEIQDQDAIYDSIKTFLGKGN